jgi:small subunit ribosomal protein S13
MNTNEKEKQNVRSDFVFRVFETDLPMNKVVRYALRYVFGIGLTRATKICELLKISDQTRVKNLNEGDMLRIQDAARQLGYEGDIGSDLRRNLIMNNARLKSIRCRRALLRERGLPCRGQRRRSNARSARRMKNAAA